MLKTTEHCWKKLKKSLINGEDILCLWIGSLNFGKIAVLSKQPTCAMQSLSSFLEEIEELILKYIWNWILNCRSSFTREEQSWITLPVPTRAPQPEQRAHSIQFSSVQSLSCVWLFVTPWTSAHQASLSTPTPGACSNPCPSSRWCHRTISSSFIPFSSCLQSFPASGSFPVSQFFTSGGQSIGASASASILPMNIQDWFPLGLTGWIPLLSKGLSRVFSNTTVWKHQFFSAQLPLWSNSHIHTWPLEKPQLCLDGPLLAKWCLCFLISCLGLS